MFFYEEKPITCVQIHRINLIMYEYILYICHYNLYCKFVEFKRRKTACKCHV